LILPTSEMSKWSVDNREDKAIAKILETNRAE
jgi:hypothetical protein